MNALNTEYSNAADQESKNKVIAKGRKLSAELKEFSMDLLLIIVIQTFRFYFLRLK